MIWKEFITNCVIPVFDKIEYVCMKSELIDQFFDNVIITDTNNILELLENDDIYLWLCFRLEKNHIQFDIETILEEIEVTIKNKVRYRDFYDHINDLNRQRKIDTFLN